LQRRIVVACQALSVHSNKQTTAKDRRPLSAACRRHQSVRSSRSNTERDHCLSENYVRFSSTVTLYLLSELLSEFCHH